MCLLVLLIGPGTLCALAQEKEQGGAASENNVIASSNAVEESQSSSAALIPCKGMIDDGLFQSIKRRCELAIENGVEYLILQIETYGGLLKSADDISKYLILDIKDRAHTVAYITTEAISAGAMISVACEDIVMLENTTIGDCAPIVMGGQLEGVEREKAESFTRAAFKRAAEANGYPDALLMAMVSQKIEVYQVLNNKTGKYEFFESEDLPKDPNSYALDDKKLVDSEDEILTLTSSVAKEYGIARAEVENLKGVMDYLSQQYDVNFATGPVEYPMLWSEQMVRWVNSPAVMSILIMLCLLGVYVELNTPGLGVPALLAVACGVIIVGSKYLVGLANWIEIAAVVMGLVLLLVEIFVIPGFGIAGISGIICLMLGLFGMLVKNTPDQIPWPQNDIDWDIFLNGILGIVGGVTGFVILAALVARFLPKMEFMSGLILAPSLSPGGATSPVSTDMPDQGRGDNQKLKVGSRGVVTSTLRPIGTAMFGEELVDVVAAAEFIEKGTEVEVKEIHGNRVVVRKVRTEQGV